MKRFFMKSGTIVIRNGAINWIWYSMVGPTIIAPGGLSHFSLKASTRIVPPAELHSIM